MKTELVHSGLVGQWFHTFSEKGEIEGQGQVIAQVSSLVYLVQWYSWVDGAPTFRKMVELAGMMGWTFYESGEAMKFCIEHGALSRMAKDQ